MDEDLLAKPKTVEIVVVGSSIYDLSISIPRLPNMGETISGEDYSATVGGKGANQAVGAARLGAAVTFVTCVGNDQFGDTFRQSFRDEGLDDSFCHVDLKSPTGIGIPLIMGDGQNAIIVAPSASRKLPVQAVRNAGHLIMRAQALLVQLECPPAAIACAMEFARTTGVPTYLDPAPLVGAVEDYVWSADVITPNESEAELLCGQKIDSIADAILAANFLRTKGPSTVIITLGKRGSVVSSSEYTGFVPAFNVDAIDTTGAGDAFAAGFAYARCTGLDLILALSFANACGALACMTSGGIPAMPTHKAVIGFMNSDPKQWQ